MKTVKILSIGVFFFSMLVMTGCVETQDFALLENRVAALESDNLRLKKKTAEYDSRLTVDFVNLEEGVGGVQKEQREKYAELNATIESLKHDISTLKGDIEESEYRLSRGGIGSTLAVDTPALERLDNAISMNYRRLVRLEKHLGLESPDLSDSSEESRRPSDTPPAEMDEDRLYSTAKALLDEGKNEGARKAFDQFIEKYATSPNADNARFWIADSYYRDKWYEKAILEYQRVIEEYPKGNKVTAALLKQGYSFAKLGEKGNARLILNDLIQKYPQSQEAKSAREKLNTLQ